MRRPEININPKNSGHTTEVLAYFFVGETRRARQVTASENSIIRRQEKLNG